MKQAELSMYEEKAALEIEMQRVKLIQDEAMADRKQSLEERKQVVAELEMVTKSMNDITDVEMAKAELANLLAQLRG
jgi:F0F1-type ATP synthase epsilon subunit